MNDEMQSQKQVVEQTSTPSKKEDFLKYTASEIENLTKTKALNRANQLVNSIDENYFELGGVLKVIYENAWFEGFESFDAFVSEKFGFQSRKAKYLMEIYDNLVNKNIPWDKVSVLGWTKLKDLARVLTLDNVDEWVDKAKSMTVAELQLVLKGSTTSAEKSSTKTADDVETLKFKLKNDQIETVTSALNKAKAEANTEYDNVALEQICAGYLGGSIGVTTQSLASSMNSIGWKGSLETFDSVFPHIHITVENAPSED